MQIVLIQPDGSGIPPLGLMYLSSVLKQAGYRDIQLADISNSSSFRKRTYSHLMELLSRNPDIVGVTSTTPSWRNAVKLCKVAREYCDQLIIGGPHASIFQEELLQKYPFIDVAIYGEADNTIDKIVDGIENKRSLCGIKGVIYRENGRIKKNEPNPPIKNLDSIPFPDRGILDMGSYHAPFSIITSRGCPYQCIFCSKPVHGNIWRARTPKNVVDEIEYLITTYPKIAKIYDGLITISDDCFNLDLNRAKKICDEIITRKLDVQLACVNGFHVKTVDYELFKKMKTAGCKELWFGVESGNPYVLEKVKKGITLDMVRNAVKLARKAGIKTIGAHFIIGLPEETLETVRDTINFARELKLDVIGFNHAGILPSTELCEFVKNNGRLLYPIKDMDYDEYRQSDPEPQFETPKFSVAERRKAFSEAEALADSVFRRRCLSPKNIMKFLLNLKSFEDLIWAIKRLNTLVLKRNLRLSEYVPPSSILKKRKEISNCDDVKGRED